MTPSLTERPSTSQAPETRIRLGTLGLAQLDWKSSQTLIATALACGIRHFDTADIYADGECEVRLGIALAAENGAHITTKIGAIPHGGERRADLRPSTIRERVDSSLRRLGVDHIGAVLLHFPDPQTPLSESLGALADLVLAGKIGAYGLSNFSAPEVESAAVLAPPRTLTLQTQYSVLFRRPEVDLFPVAHKHGMPVQAWGALGSGWLTAEASREGHATVDDARAARRAPTFDPSLPANRRKTRVAKRLALISKETGLSVPSIAIRFALIHPSVSSVVIGPTTPSQVRENTDAADGSISIGIRGIIDSLVAPGSAVNIADSA